MNEAGYKLAIGQWSDVWGHLMLGTRRQYFLVDPGGILLLFGQPVIDFVLCQGFEVQIDSNYWFSIFNCPCHRID
jgi:hypothetical protein